MNFIGCYSTSFRWWDHFMGTDTSYQRYKARKAAANKDGKNVNFVPYEMVSFLYLSLSDPERLLTVVLAGGQGPGTSLVEQG